MAPVQRKSISFTDEMWSAIQRQADEEGISASALVRDATSVYLTGRKNDAHVDSLKELAQRVDYIERHLGIEPLGGEQ